MSESAPEGHRIGYSPGRWAVPCCHPYLAAEKTETERLNNSPEVPELVSGSSWLKLSPWAPKPALPASLNRVFCAEHQPQLIGFVRHAAWWALWIHLDPRLWRSSVTQKCVWEGICCDFQCRGSQMVIHQPALFDRELISQVRKQTSIYVGCTWKAPS